MFKTSCLKHRHPWYFNLFSHLTYCLITRGLTIAKQCVGAKLTVFYQKYNNKNGVASRQAKASVYKLPRISAFVKTA